MFSDPTATPRSLDADALMRARLRFLFDGMPISLGMTPILVLITTLVLRDPGAIGIYVWAAIMLCAVAFRGWVYVGYRKTINTAGFVPKPWHRRFVAGCIAGGAAWGCAPLFLFPDDITRQVFLSFVIAGTSAAAVTAMSADRQAALGFILPSILPLGAMLMLQQTSIGLGMSIMVLMYLVLVTAAVNRSYFQLIAAEDARLEARRHRDALQRSERERQVSDEKLRALFEFSPLGIALLDDGDTIIEANPALADMIGTQRALLQGRALGAKLIETSHTAVDLEATTTDLLHSLEYELDRYDGRKLSVAINGMRIQHASGDTYRWVFIENIDERKADEERMRELKDRLLLAAEAGELGIWEYDVATRRLLWNPQMHAIYDIAPTSTNVYEEWRQRLHPADMAIADTAIAAALKGESALDLQFRIVRPDGQERTIKAAGIVRADPITKALRMTGVNWDVTELKRVERMKTEFVSTVSHELRTPLTSIRGSLALVANGRAGEIPPKAKDMLDIASRNAERLALLIDDLLDIERIESGKLRMDMQAHSLQELLEQSVASSAAYATLYNVRIDLQSSVGDGRVRVDSNRFLQVMANLLSNAAKFSPAQSSVVVSAVRIGEHVRIEVRDAGGGIAPEFADRMFTKFSQGDSSDTRKRGGTGLGLAISKALVEQMHGQIGYVTEVGVGTTFYIELPLATGD